MNSTDTLDILTRLDIDAAAPAFTRALASLDAATTKQLDEAGIEPGLRELIRLRASQLNGCAYCVSQHTRDALDASEPIGRIAALADTEATEADLDLAWRLREAIHRAGTAIADDDAPDPQDVGLINALARDSPGLSRTRRDDRVLAHLFKTPGPRRARHHRPRRHQRDRRPRAHPAQDV